MQRTKSFATLIASAVLFVSLPAFADNGAYTGSGGSFSPAGMGGSITTTDVPLSGTTASYSFSCPVTSYGAGTYAINWTCAGGTISIVSTDNSISLQGTFLSGTMNFSGSGGGRGGNVNYWYSFNAPFSGTVTVGGVSQAVYGSISQSVKTKAQGSGPVYAASIGWASAYSPLLVGDSSNGRLLAADNIAGANLTSFGTYGSGVGEFQLIAGLTQDAHGRIYVADSSVNRVVRVDNFAGTNWISLGRSGGGVGQFNQPHGLTVDPTGNIWVADSGNNRIVRFDDMTGSNWTSFGTTGDGANQFVSPSSIAFDAAGHIYVADTGNNRLVRMDDLSGTNWTTLSQINIDPYGYPLGQPQSVAVDRNGRIYVANGNGYLLSFTDMTGANPKLSYWTNAFTSLSLDRSGTVVVAGNFTQPLAVVEDAAATGYFTAELGLSSLSPTAVLARMVTSPPPAAPVLSSKGLNFGKRNVGEPSATQQVTLTNLGGHPLPITSITASSDFPLTNGCGSPLPGGSSCTIEVSFKPTVTGTRTARLTILTTSAHPSISAYLSGFGTAPVAALVPTALAFDPQQTTTASGPQLVTLSNTGTGPLTISSIRTSANFSQTNHCPAVLAAGAGCTLSISFQPGTTGPLTGIVAIADDAVASGATQTINLSGTGTSSTPAFTLTPESLFFPDQQVGVVSGTQSVTLKNNSGSSASLPAPVYPAEFSGTTTCGATLATGASCLLRVQFKPTASGNTSALVSVPISGKPSLTLGLAGVGTSSAAAVLSVNPPSVAFGTLAPGDNSDQNFTITNPTGIPAGIRSVLLSGSSAFSVTSNNCPAILGGGASCVMQVTFAPATTGSYSANLLLTETSGAETSVAITGAQGSSGN